MALLPNCFVIFRQVFLDFGASKSLKLYITLNCVLNCANDLKTMILCSFSYEQQQDHNMTAVVKFVKNVSQVNRYDMVPEYVDYHEQDN